MASLSTMAEHAFSPKSRTFSQINSLTQLAFTQLTYFTKIPNQLKQQQKTKK